MRKRKVLSVLLGLLVAGFSLIAQAQSGPTTVVLSANVVNNNASANTMADVTGLSFPVVNGNNYSFQFYIVYSAQATTTGSRWSINGPTNTRLVYWSQYDLTATTSTLNRGLATYNSPAASNATSVNTSFNIARIEGFITPSQDGTVICRFASEVSNSAITAIAGVSYVTYQKLN